ncbi:2-oxo acid dehydrogenase subunit E2 [Streptomyces sp. NPDC021020]|uniref:2-oxo acid dehydrogenase subunit E2 n=1 Tax=Streptomyces sp. NPDC021020 TaxID=3365109 RepID=UPI0037A11414
MHVVEIPRLNSNDDTCRLVEWTGGDGDRVEDEATVAVVETSKAASDICSEAAGILHTVAAVGAEVRVGEVIGYVFADEDERREFLARNPAPPQVPADSPAGDGPADGLPVLTAPARKLSEEAGLTAADLRGIGKRLVQRSDVEALLAAAGGQRADTLPARQQAVARAVTRAHREVPAAFVVVKVYCDALLDRLAEVNGRDGTAIGVPEAAIAALAGLRERFPLFFTLLEDGERLVPPGERTDIGITVDVGTGLFVPVVTDAGRLGPSGIADRLLEFRIAALRDAFRAEQLTGGQLSVSLHNDADVIAAVPIILAPQVCMLSLPAVQSELHLDADGRVAARRHMSVGLAYDHRLVNGRDAVAFLTAFKAALENPQEAGL